VRPGCLSAGRPLQRVNHVHRSGDRWASASPSKRERGGPLPSIDVADALLDERRELSEWAITRRAPAIRPRWALSAPLINVSRCSVKPVGRLQPGCPVERSDQPAPMTCHNFRLMPRSFTAPKGFPWSPGWGLPDLLHQEVARARAAARYSAQTPAQLLAERIRSG
jgi:hypothetical protein